MSRRGNDSIGDHTGAMVFGALLGGLAAAAGTLLYTPWSGQRLREKVFGPVMSAGSSVASSPVMEKASNLVQQGASVVAPAADSVAAAAQKGAAKGSAVVHDATEQVQQLTGRKATNTTAVEPEVVVVETPENKPNTTL